MLIAAVFAPHFPEKSPVTKSGTFRVVSSLQFFFLLQVIAVKAPIGSSLRYSKHSAVAAGAIRRAKQHFSVC